MSGDACGTCGAVAPLYDGDAGASLAESFGVPLIHRLPFLPGQRADRASILDVLASACLAVLP